MILFFETIPMFCFEFRCYFNVSVWFEKSSYKGHSEQTSITSVTIGSYLSESYLTTQQSMIERCCNNKCLNTANLIGCFVGLFGCGGYSNRPVENFVKPQPLPVEVY